MSRCVFNTPFGLDLITSTFFTTLLIHSGGQARIWTGKYLGLTITGENPCSSSPCLNSGTCRVVSTLYGVSFSCHCGNSFSGNVCQTATVNPCASSPCLNGGKCLHQLNTSGFLCQCEPGYHGLTCGETLTDCKNCPQVFSFRNACFSRPCQNNGVCRRRRGRDGYRCVCPRGYKGTQCQIPDCADHSCTNVHSSCGDNNSSCVCTDIHGRRNCVSSNATIISRTANDTETDTGPVLFEDGFGSFPPLVFIVCFLALTTLVCGSIAFIGRVVCGRKKPDDYCMNIPRRNVYHVRNNPSISRNRLSTSSSVRFYQVNTQDSASNLECTQPPFTTQESRSICCNNINNNDVIVP